MKKIFNKKNIIIFIVLIIVLGIGLYVLISSNTKKDKSKNKKIITIEERLSVYEKETGVGIKYRCLKEDSWKKMSEKKVNGSDLGKYKLTTMFSFYVDEDKYVNSNVLIYRYEFNTLYGYDYINKNEIFKLSSDNQNMIKDFYTEEVIPITITDNTTTDNYLSELTSQGYNCKKIK